MRRWVARATLVVVVLVAAHAVVRGLADARGVWRRAHRWRGEDLAAAQDRLFGRDYMAAIRELRRRIPESATVFLADRQSRQQGACYFALHYLAPRRFVWIPSADLEPQRRARANPISHRSWVVAVGDPGTPLALLQAPALERVKKRGR